MVEWGWAFLLIGCIGNGIDRIFYPYGVIDFVNIQIIPVFNIADMAINVGVLALIWDSYLSGKYTEGQ